MIDALLFAAVMLAVTLAFAVFLDHVGWQRATIHCNCGSSKAVDILVGDDSDRRRTKETLSENCPTCRALARSIPSRAVPSRDLPSRAVPSRAIPSRDLPSRDVPSRDRKGADEGGVTC